jgi:hypothetical protein
MEERETYGFRSNRSTPFIRELKAFEDDLYELLAYVKFSHIPIFFLNELDKDVCAIKSSHKPIIPSDKTGNFY